MWLDAHFQGKAIMIFVCFSVRHTWLMTGLTQQVVLPDWPGRLPNSLTQLVLAPLHNWLEDKVDRVADRAEGCTSFFRLHLPQLRSLRHLAFHRLKEVGEHQLQRLCIVAGALPQLISLHLVRSLSLTLVNCLQVTA